MAKPAVVLIGADKGASARPHWRGRFWIISLPANCGRAHSTLKFRAEPSNGFTRT